MDKKVKESSNSKVVKIAAKYRVSFSHHGGTYYTYEYYEEREVNEGVKVATERKLLWDKVIEEVDKQIELT